MSPSTLPRVYFMFPQPDPPRHVYHHAMVVLAEGLAELGIPIHPNIDAGEFPSCAHAARACQAAYLSEAGPVF
jgi:hypothetical protein